ncbi:MAG: T9SS type A sorting domain-containing protein [Bacteroidetes bacterium]|nr:T9SS type A sorting domain-containing protein [Bacteroidota bacterium]
MNKLYTIAGLMAGIMLFIGSTQFASAQKYSFTPSKTISSSWDGKSTLEMHMNINNLTNSELKLSWKLIKSELPFDWEYTICDNAQCYSAFKTLAEFGALAKGEAAFFIFDIFAIQGEMSKNVTVQLGVFETANPSVVDTVTFFVQSPNSVEEQAMYSVGISPNPATETLTISAESALNSLQIFSALGTKVMEMNNANNTEITVNIHELPSGVYYIKARDMYGKVVATKFQKI